MNVQLISGNTGQYSPINSENWGRNASQNFQKATVANLNNKFEIRYSKPANPLLKSLIQIGKSIEKGFRKVGLLPKKSVNANINFKSLLGYASEDLKTLNPSVKANPKLKPADTDNDGQISLAENAAYVIMADMLDKKPDLYKKEHFDLKASDADGKITNVGHNNAMGLILGKSKDSAKQMLTEIREKFDLDKKTESIDIKRL